MRWGAEMLESNTGPGGTDLGVVESSGSPKRGFPQWRREAKHSVDVIASWVGKHRRVGAKLEEVEAGVDLAGAALSTVRCPGGA
jgi:hypothetical protein